MNYAINPDTQPNYFQIKKNFNNIKNIEQTNIYPQFNILISNDINSYARGKFIEEREKYIGKIISIFIIRKKGLTQIVGPVLITNVQILIDIMNYVNEFIPTENVYIEEQDDLEKQLFNYYNNYNDIKITNIIYN
jgi:hypothetical protein